MKKCSRCSKPSTLHITELRDGAVQELHLCESCAHEYLSHSDEAESAGEADGIIDKIAEATGDEDLEKLDQLVCPNCGISFREFRSQGRLGCPHDYIAFEDELMPLLENIHGELQHAGKFPKRAPDASRRQYRLIKLRNELRTAVEDEAYEEAAHLRDEISLLEADLQEEGSESE
jgi:protein arginine kinase activator